MPEDPQPSFDPPAPHPATSVAPGSGLLSKQAAGFASLFPLFGGVIFYFLDRRDAFVRYHAVQSILLGLALLLVTLTTEFGYYLFSYLWVIGVMLHWILSVLYHVFELAWALLWIITTICAFQGKQWQVPYLAPVVKRLSVRAG